MEVIIIFLFIVFALNCVPLLIKNSSPRLERTLIQISNYTLIIFLVFTVLLFCGYRLKGIYTNTVLGVVFILSSALLFTFVKHSRKKLLRILIYSPLIFLSIFILMFVRVKSEFNINDTYKIQIGSGGFLGCGNSFNISESKFGVFDHVVYNEGSLCLQGIDKIDVLNFEGNYGEFMIFHDGEFDSENPFRLEVDIKNNK